MACLFDRAGDSVIHFFGLIENNDYERNLYKEGKGERLKVVNEWNEYKLFEITR